MQKSVYHQGPARVSSTGTSSVITDGVKRVLALMAVLILALTTFASAGAGKAKAMDNWIVNQFVCGWDLGLNTSWIVNPGVNYLSSSEESGYNKITMQDLYGNQLNWTTYNGSKSPKKLDRNKDNILGAATTADNNNVSGRLAEGQPIQTASDEVHDFACPVRSIATMLSGTILGTAGMVSNFTSLFVTSAVDPEFICQDPANSDNKMCINLLGVIAGDGAVGSDGGLIGRLYSGLYSGLCVMAFAAVGIWAAWTGLAKRKLTSALGGVFTAVLIFGAGVILMNNPLLLAKAPMQIGTSLGGCVVMGVNGQNCMSTNSGSHGSTNKKNSECYVDTDGELSATRAMALSAKSASCKVWKAFVFEPWVAGQFGTSYNELFTGGDPGGYEAGPLFTNSKTKDNLDYWKNIKVGLYTTDQKPSSICSNTDDTYRYSNLALYQLNLMSEPALHACGVPYHRPETIKGAGMVYGDWLWLIDAMSQARETKGETGADNLSIMWASWSGNNYWGRFSIAIISLLTSVLGAGVLITTAVLAMVYLFMSVLLTAFAPLFFLIGLIPGQGKRIMLGWIEKIAANTLKYFGCILWMMVTLELYAAVLGNANSNLGMTFIFTIIVTLAMWLYRGEFLKMIGKANFGGTQMSNAVGDWMKNKANSVKDTAVSTGAGYVGGLMSGRTAPKVKEGDAKAGGGTYSREEARAYNKAHSRLANAKDGAGYQFTQSMKRKGGVVGAAALVKDRIDDNKRRQHISDNHEVAKKAVNVADNLKTTLKGLGLAEDEMNKIMQLTGGDAVKFQQMVNDGSLFMGTGIKNWKDDSALRVANAAAQKKARQVKAHEAEMDALHDTNKSYGGYLESKDLMGSILDKNDAGTYGMTTNEAAQKIRDNASLMNKLGIRDADVEGFVDDIRSNKSNARTQFSDAVTDLGAVAAADFAADQAAGVFGTGTALGGASVGNLSNLNDLASDMDAKDDQLQDEMDVASKEAEKERIDLQAKNNIDKTMHAYMIAQNMAETARMNESRSQSRRLSGRTRANDIDAAQKEIELLDDVVNTDRYGNTTVDVDRLNSAHNVKVYHDGATIGGTTGSLSVDEWAGGASQSAGTVIGRGYGPTPVDNPNATTIREHW